MSDFWTSEKGTDMVECGNKFAACVCNRKVHSPTDPCVCACGGSWHYNDDGREVPDSLPGTAEGYLGINEILGGLL